MTARTTYTEQERADALGRYEHDGLAEAARATSVPKSTIRGWAAAAGIRTCGTEQTRAANEVRAVDLEARRQSLAVRLYDEADAALDAITRPVPVYGMTRDGLGTGLAPAANPADRQRLMTTAAIAVDKAQLLTGQATERLDDAGEYDLEGDLRAAQARDAELRRLRLVVGEG